MLSDCVLNGGGVCSFTSGVHVFGKRKKLGHNKQTDKTIQTSVGGNMLSIMQKVR